MWTLPGPATWGPPNPAPGEHPAVTPIDGCLWAPSLSAAQCFEQAEPRVASGRAGGSARLLGEAQVGSPVKSPSQLTAPPHAPTASHRGSPLPLVRTSGPRAAIFPENTQPAAAPPEATVHRTPLSGAGTMALCKPARALDEEGEPGERGVPSQPGQDPGEEAQCPLLPHAQGLEVGQLESEISSWVLCHPNHGDFLQVETSASA